MAPMMAGAEVATGVTGVQREATPSCLTARYDGSVTNFYGWTI
jgi:hypothetical protein